MTAVTPQLFQASYSFPQPCITTGRLALEVHRLSPSLGRGVWDWQALFSAALCTSTLMSFEEESATQA